ncbi:hypothetical protein SCUP234_10904 [Seiridium cupressi]
MSDLSPSAPSQPPTDAAYETQNNPVTSTPSEQHSTSQTRDQGNTVERRDHSSAASSGQDAAASSLGRGVHGAGPGEEAKGRTQGQLDSRGLEGEQIHPSGEGDVAAAVERKSGAGGGQPDLAGDLERKKAEQSR